MSLFGTVGLQLVIGVCESYLHSGGPKCEKCHFWADDITFR